MKTIKLYAFLVTLLCLCFNQSKAQGFQENDVNVQFGYGVGNLAQSFFSAFKDELNYEYKAKGPFFAKLEYAVSDTFGFGVNLAYVGADVTWNETDNVITNIDWYSLSLLVRANYHFGNNPKFDPYIGAGFGYRTASWDISYSDPDFDGDLSFDNFFPLGFETTIGARYFFTEQLGVYIEAGIAKAVFQAGVNVKI